MGARSANIASVRELSVVEASLSARPPREWWHSSLIETSPQSSKLETSLGDASTSEVPALVGEGSAAAAPRREAKMRARRSISEVMRVVLG